jgi:hypothetical protein
VISIYFLGHSYVVLSRRTQQNHQKISECSNLPNLSVSLPSLFGRIYLTKSDISIGFQNHGTASRSDISDPISDISNQPDMSSPHRVPEPLQAARVRHIRPIGFVRPSSGCRSIVPFLERIYPSHIGYICPSRILSQFESPIRHIRSRSDIADVLTPPTVIIVWGL